MLDGDPAIASVSARVSTMPVGLCGLLSSSSLVLLVMSDSSRARSGRNPGGRRVSGTRVAPAIAMLAT